MATIRGLFSSNDYESDIDKLDVRDVIFELQPSAAPFVTLLNKVNKRKAHNMTINWFEDDLISNYTQDNGGHTDVDIVIDVDDASIFQVGDVVKNLQTDECMLVTAVDDTSDTITVSRGWGDTAAATITDNDYLYRLTPAMKEGYNTPDSLVTVKTEKTNYLQIFSKAVKITETADKIDTYGGNRLDFERNKKAVELKRELESQLIWGEPKKDVSGSEPRYQTGGVYHFLGATAPELDMGSARLTESAFEGHLQDVFLYGTEKRVLFGGPRILSQITQFATPKQRIDPGVTTAYGLKVTRYVSANGIIDLVRDAHFTGPNAGKALILDPSELVYRYLQGMDWQLQLNKQPNNAHYKLDEYCGHVGLEIHHALMHGTIKGVTE